MTDVKQESVSEAWEEYEACEAECCPICGSYSPTHIQENGDEPCHEQRRYSEYLR